MGRIRSLHPEQWTDENFVSCSPLARLLALAIRNECDDRGVFEWKPITLKMRCLPVDDCNVSDLLAELVETNQVYKFSSGGKSYGAVRNFTRFQRPKKPNYKFPIPPDFPTAYVPVPNDDEDNGDEIPHQLPTSGEPVPHQYGKSDSDVMVVVRVEKSINPLASLAPPLEGGGTPLPDGNGQTNSMKLKTTRGSRIHGSLDDGCIPNEWGYWARDELGWPNDTIANIGEDFCDWWQAKAGAGGVKLDWFKTWKVWCRKEQKKFEEKAQRDKRWGTK